MGKDDEGFIARHILLFLTVLCLLSWPFWIISGVLTRSDFLYDYRWLISQIGVFGPSIAALLVSGKSSKDLRRNSLRILPVILFPLIIPGIIIASFAGSKVINFPLFPSATIVLAATVIVLYFSPLNRHLLLPGTGKNQGKAGKFEIILSIALLPALFLLAWLFIGNTDRFQATSFFNQSNNLVWTVFVVFCHNLLLGGSLGEEIGWRGYLLPQLLKNNSPLAASIILGIVWGLWHMPIDINSGFLIGGPAAIIIRIIWVIPLSVIFTWFYLHSSGNILTAMFLHTSINILPDLGFPNYEIALIPFFFLILFTAIVLSLSVRCVEQFR